MSLKNNYFSINAIQIALFVLYYNLSFQIINAVTLLFIDNIILGFLYLFISIVPIALWVMSVGYWALISINSGNKNIDNRIVLKIKQYRFYKSTLFIKHSFVISVVVFTLSIYIKGLYL